MEGDSTQGPWTDMATTVFRIPFSIGYVEQACAMGLTLPFAALHNRAGSYVTPCVQLYR